MDVLNVILICSVFGINEIKALHAFDNLWNYDVNNLKIGPSNWSGQYPKCSGSHQSPINIVTDKVKYNKDLKPLVVGNYKNTQLLENVIYEMVNHGHALRIDVKRSGSLDKSPVTVTYDGVTWRLAQFHFHWGSIDSQGSEHTIDGKAFSAEMHMVHYNTKYMDFNTAASKPDGLLVWGTLIQVGGDKNENLDNVIKFIRDVELAQEKVNITVFPALLLLPELAVDNYYKYDGSLTTPSCSQSVTWIVNKNYIKISSAQIDEFRQLRQTHNVTDLTKVSNNFRPIQKLNGRVVEKSFDGSNNGNNCSSSGNALLGSLLTIVAALFVYTIQSK